MHTSHESIMHYDISLYIILYCCGLSYIISLAYLAIWYAIHTRRNPLEDIGGALHGTQRCPQVKCQLVGVIGASVDSSYRSARLAYASIC